MRTSRYPFKAIRTRFDLPGLWGSKLRLGVGLSFFEQANGGWFGVGSRSQRRRFTQDELSASETARRFHEYRTVVPSVRGSGRLIVWEQPVAVGKRRLEVFVSGSLSYNETELYAGSLLAQQAAPIEAWVEVFVFIGVACNQKRRFYHTKDVFH